MVLVPKMKNCNATMTFTISSNKSLSILRTEIQSMVSKVWLGSSTDVGPIIGNQFLVSISEIPAKMDGCDWGFGTCNPWTSRDCVVERQELILLASMFGIIYPVWGSSGSGEQLNPDVEHH
jgi:hypothetical protein